jgi:hypothetical protein
MNSTPIVGDFVALRPFPAVVSGAQIRELREMAFVDERNEVVRDFLGGFLGFDARSSHALDQLIGSLSQARSGGAVLD